MLCLLFKGYLSHKCCTVCILQSPIFCETLCKMTLAFSRTLLFSFSMTWNYLTRTTASCYFYLAFTPLEGFQIEFPPLVGFQLAFPPLVSFQLCESFHLCRCPSYLRAPLNEQSYTIARCTLRDGRSDAWPRSQLPQNVLNLKLMRIERNYASLSLWTK